MKFETSILFDKVKLDTSELIDGPTWGVIRAHDLFEYGLQEAILPQYLRMKLDVTHWFFLLAVQYWS